MNDHTPIRLKGSLLERAFAIDAFKAPPLPDLPPEEPRFVPVPEPEVAVRPPFAFAESPAAPAVQDRRATDTLAPAAFDARAPFLFDDEEPQPIAAPAPSAYHVGIDRGALAARGMIVPGAAITPIAEEFRLVKRQLLQKARGLETAAARAILVCSARPNDGKTFCAINLALSLAAERDVEVVLVDADFAKPDVFKALGVETQGPGLLDALADRDLDIEELIVDTDVPQLRLLSAGTRSHSDVELLASAYASRVLRRLTTANPRRIVVFDSPPALAASPANVLAASVGQVMLVVRADTTSEGDLRAAVGLLDGCEHIQLLLNSVSYQPGGNRFGYYYGEEDAA